MKNKNFILETIKEDFNIIKEYKFGSELWGSTDEESDIDICLVASDIDEYHQYETKEIDIHILGKDTYQRMLNEMDDMALAMYFQDKDKIVDFKLNKPLLRKFFSTKANNSFVKSKKKFLQEDIRLAYKSMYHSLRLLKWGHEIAIGNGENYNNLIDYYSIKENFLKSDWESLQRIYKPQFNILATLFRKVAPKE
jgi:predicted nucleotidyltransferase